MLPDTFARVVEQAMKELPAEYLRLLDAVTVVVEEEPTARLLNELEMEQGEELFGLYVGLPLHDESFFRSGGQEPAQIVLFRGPILRQCDTEAEMTQEIVDTLVHELGHHVGLHDDDMPY